LHEPASTWRSCTEPPNWLPAAGGPPLATDFSVTGRANKTFKIGMRRTTDEVIMHSDDQEIVALPAPLRRAVDADEWLHEVDALRDHYADFGHRLPAAFGAQLDQSASRLQACRRPGTEHPLQRSAT
jgi:hypothetical protein